MDLKVLIPILAMALGIGAVALVLSLKALGKRN